MKSGIKLKRVTITGADDGTDIGEMLEIAAKFPFVEWGILVSERHEGSVRFPGRQWIARFAQEALGLNISTHVCGVWVRRLLVGELRWEELPACLDISQRVQINTHAEQAASTVGMVANLYALRRKQVIFQWDGVNNHLASVAWHYKVNCAALFDKSGGAGLVPAAWPNPVPDFPCGFAGGLSPDNLTDQLAKINAACPANYETWIDMEGKVRTYDGLSLDMTKVEKVLELAKEFAA